MEISDSNMANRFYGQKRMDDAEANRFTERLGLPTGWLDVPRSIADVPESVSDLLVSPSRRHASDQQALPPAIEPKATAEKKSAGTKAKTAGARLALPPDADGTGGPTGIAAETNVVTGQLDQAVPSAADPAIRQTVDNDVSFSTARQQFAPAPVTQIVTSHRSCRTIRPVANYMRQQVSGSCSFGESMRRFCDNYDGRW
ncbi:hypothetical protein [Caballeronia udeis]|nr:hypothetical protein [Caballeronia udeis]